MWTEGPFGYDIHFTMKGILKILLDCDEVKQTSSRCKLDEKIYVAGGIGVTPRNGAENSHVGRTMTGSQAGDCFSIMIAQAVHRFTLVWAAQIVPHPVMDRDQAAIEFAQ